MSLEQIDDAPLPENPAREDPLASATPSGTVSPADSDPPGTPLTVPEDADDALHDNEDTFYQLMSIHIDQPIGSMSISPANRDVALGSRTGLYIVDLQNPYDPPRFLPHASAWEVSDVQVRCNRAENPLPNADRNACAVESVSSSERMGLLNCKFGRQYSPLWRGC